MPPIYDVRLLLLLRKFFMARILVSTELARTRRQGQKQQQPQQRGCVFSYSCTWGSISSKQVKLAQQMRGWPKKTTTATATTLVKGPRQISSFVLCCCILLGRICGAEFSRRCVHVPFINVELPIKESHSAYH